MSNRIHLDADTPDAACQALDLCTTTEAERGAVEEALRGVVVTRPEDLLVHLAFQAGAQQHLRSLLMQVTWRLAALLGLAAEQPAPSADTLTRVHSTVREAA